MSYTKEPFRRLRKSEMDKLFNDKTILLEACKRAFRFIDYSSSQTGEIPEVLNTLAKAISKAEDKD